MSERLRAMDVEAFAAPRGIRIDDNETPLVSKIGIWSAGVVRLGRSRTVVNRYNQRGVRGNVRRPVVVNPDVVGIWAEIGQLLELSHSGRDEGGDDAKRRERGDTHVGFDANADGESVEIPACILNTVPIVRAMALKLHCDEGDYPCDSDLLRRINKAVWKWIAEKRKWVLR